AEWLRLAPRDDPFASECLPTAPALDVVFAENFGSARPTALIAANAWSASSSTITNPAIGCFANGAAATTWRMLSARVGELCRDTPLGRTPAAMRFGLPPVKVDAIPPVSPG